MEKIEYLLQQELALKKRIQEFKAVIEEEKDLRKKICLMLLEGKADGTHKFCYKNMAVKVVKSSTYSLDQKEVARLIADNEFTPEELEAIRIKYELNLSNYKKLDNSELLDNYITVKDAMPTIEIEEM